MSESKPQDGESAEITGSSESNTSLRGTMRETLSVSGLTALSRLLGFIRTMVLSTLFGATGVADVINLTFGVPNNLRKLLAEGALSAAFIPPLSSSITDLRHSTRESREVVEGIVTFQLIVLIPLVVISILFAAPIITLILAEFDDPAMQKLAVGLFRWFINYLPLISISAVIMGTLNAHHRYAIPATTPLIFSIFVITSITIFTKLGAYSMVVGVILGGVGQILFQYPLFHRFGYRFRLRFNFRSGNMIRIFRSWLPVLSTSSVFSITQLVAYRLASGLEEGSVSSLAYALVFWQLPLGVFSTSLTTVMFPKMSRHHAQKREEQLGRSMWYGVRFLMTFLIPSAVFLSLFGREMISATIQWGKFTAEDTNNTAMVLRLYSIGLLSVGVFNLLQRFFYSIDKYKIPFWIALATGGIDILLSLWLKETYLGVGGIALANSIAFSLGALSLLTASCRYIGRVGLIEIAHDLPKILLGSAIMGIYLFLLREIATFETIADSRLADIVIFMGGVVGSTAILVGFFWWMKVDPIVKLLRRSR